MYNSAARLDSVEEGIPFEIEEVDYPDVTCNYIEYPITDTIEEEFIYEEDLYSEDYEDYSEEYTNYDYVRDYYGTEPEINYYLAKSPFSFLTFAPLAVLAISVLLILMIGVLKFSPSSDAQAANQPEAISQTGTSIDGGQTTIDTGTGTMASFFTPSIQYWKPQILQWAEQWNLDPNLIATIMQIESCGNPDVASSAGAMGLFQVMPFHFQPGENGYDPQTNAKRGMLYLKQALKTLGNDPRLALAGYNGGITGAQNPEAYWHNETQRYVYWGTGIFADAQAGKDSSSRLEEWLQAGGNGLCLRAAQQLGINK